MLYHHYFEWFSSENLSLQMILNPVDYDPVSCRAESLFYVHDAFQLNNVVILLLKIIKLILQVEIV